MKYKRNKYGGYEPIRVRFLAIVAWGVFCLVIFGVSMVACARDIDGRGKTSAYVVDSELRGKVAVEETGIEKIGKENKYSIEGSLNKEELIEKYGVNYIVSAYNSVPEQTDKSPCIGANGDNICTLLHRGVRACASNSFPFGTRLSIANVGDCVVLDRTHPRFAGRIDVYMGGRDSIQDARAWGVRQVKVVRWYEVK